MDRQIIVDWVMKSEGLGGDLFLSFIHYQKYFLKIFLKLECISCPIVSKYKLILRKYII